MADDFMVCVDRIMASACFESMNGERDRNIIGAASGTTKNINESVVYMKSNSNGKGCSSLKSKAMKEMVECRICQEDDEVHSMEAPCACNGTLKFAHRKCIQRWCNKKGDITCEICGLVFSPNYSVPPAHSNPDVMAINIRHTWGQPIDLRDSHLLALAVAERHLLQSEYEDYAVANASSIACLRSVALILLVVLLLFQALLVIRDAGTVQESSTLFNVSPLWFVGFLLPCYVMAGSWYIVQSRRRQG